MNTKHFFLHLLTTIFGLSLHIGQCQSGHHHMNHLSIHRLHNKYSHLPPTALNRDEVDKAELRFRFSAKNLPKSDRFGKSDPFIKVSFLDETVKEETSLGESSIIQDNSSPKWGDVFIFQYVKANKQKLHVVVYDKDPWQNDKVGEAYIHMTDYVQNNENLQVDLDNGGFLIIEKA